MWFLTISSKICVSAAVFYSAFFLSKCRASPEFVWLDNKVVYIYRTEVPPTWKKSRMPPTPVIIWIAVVVVCMVLCFTCCILCNVLKRRNTDLIRSHPEAIVVFQADSSTAAYGQVRNPTTTNNIFGNGVVNFGFTGIHQNMSSDDGPPEYSSVVSQTSSNFRSEENNASTLQFSGMNTNESPPPAYTSVTSANDYWVQ